MSMCVLIKLCIFLAILQTALCFSWGHLSNYELTRLVPRAMTTTMVKIVQGERTSTPVASTVLDQRNYLLEEKVKLAMSSTALIMTVLVLPFISKAFHSHKVKALVNILVGLCSLAVLSCCIDIVIAGFNLYMPCEVALHNSFLHLLEIFVKSYLTIYWSALLICENRLHILDKQKCKPVALAAEPASLYSICCVAGYSLLLFLLSHAMGTVDITIRSNTLYLFYQVPGVLMLVVYSFRRKMKGDDAVTVTIKDGTATVKDGNITLAVDGGNVSLKDGNTTFDSGVCDSEVTTNEMLSRTAPADTQLTKVYKPGHSCAVLKPTDTYVVSNEKSLFFQRCTKSSLNAKEYWKEEERGRNLSNCAVYSTSLSTMCSYDDSYPAGGHQMADVADVDGVNSPTTHQPTSAVFSGCLYRLPLPPTATDVAETANDVTLSACDPQVRLPSTTTNGCTSSPCMAGPPPSMNQNTSTTRNDEVSTDHRRNATSDYGSEDTCTSPSVSRSPSTTSHVYAELERCQVCDSCDSKEHVLSSTSKTDSVFTNGEKPTTRQLNAQVFRTWCWVVILVYGSCLSWTLVGCVLEIVFLPNPSVWLTFIAGLKLMLSQAPYVVLSFSYSTLLIQHRLKRTRNAPKSPSKAEKGQSELSEEELSDKEGLSTLV